MRLEIQCEDRIGMVSEILSLLVSSHIDIRLIEIDSNRRCIYCGFSDIPFPTLQKLLADIRRLESVKDVRTVMFTPFEQEHSSLYSLLEALPDGAILVDLKGNITMMTRKAEAAFKVTGADFLHVPFSQLVKSLNTSKGMWSRPQKSVKKYVRIANQKLLLEINPILAADEEGVKKPVASAVYVKTEAGRFDREIDHHPLASRNALATSLKNVFSENEVKSAAMQRVLSDAEAFCSLDFPVLIQGEFGVGKKRLSKVMFDYWEQQQCDTPVLVTHHAKDITLENIDALYSSSDWLVIEDIQQLRPSVQAWLLDKLAHSDEPNENFDTVQNKARIIGLTSLNTAQILEGCGFSKALYFSLSKLSLSIPSLRDRKEDIAGLLESTLSELSTRHGIPTPSVSEKAKLKLSLYDWPGNLSELENICTQLLLTKTHSHLEAEDIDFPSMEAAIPISLINNSLESTVKHWESALLRKMYVDFPSSRRLAKAVGVSHSTIAVKLKEYGIQSKKPD
ncbi:sigma 54-interacting transcriptional regulator [Marinomonas sp. C2222]|uniref:Sigma 54-interacting transcriptional regulator n=1 Tax=Marinomonas sargassi TaxID=2984494 RepID=A0ABT2YQI3_9GAMM|nr:TyrR/PhhR family helix-turn-helix DNA-binding protein [Marinomonas sargassi]MCV2402157.1 sigma 54-interacting transcriptional regulator [Marinomonas sargassi]